MKRSEATGRQEQSSVANGLVTYLVSFANRLIRMLKHCIMRLFETRPRLLLQRNQNGCMEEARTHYNMLMQSTANMILSLKPHTSTMLASGCPTPEWSDPMMVESRSRELQILSSYLTGTTTSPGLLFGPPGSGKSSLLRWIVNRFKKQVSNTKKRQTKEETDESVTVNPVLVVCCAARTTLSSTLQALLGRIVEELSVQFNTTTSNPNLGAVCEYAEAVYMLQSAFRFATAQRPVLIIIDDVERLFPREHVEMFRWLPAELSNRFVRILMSTSSESALTGFSQRYGTGCCLRLGPCLNAERFLSTLLPCWIHNRQTQVKMKSSTAPGLLSSHVVDIASEAVQKNRTPLYLDILTDILAVSESEKSIIPSESVPEDLSELFSVRLKQIQQYTSTKCRLLNILLKLTAYIACSRFGLTLCELLDLLAIDRDIQSECKRQNSDTQFFRFPVGCLLHLLYNPEFGISKYLVLTQTDNRCVITFGSDAVRQGVLKFWSADDWLKDHISPQIAHSLNNKEDEEDKGSDRTNRLPDTSEVGSPQPANSSMIRSLYNAMADYWLRPPSSTETNKRVLTQSNETESNRYNASFITMYYWQALISTGSATDPKSPCENTTYYTWICNSRRLTELPYQLMQAGSSRVQDIFKHVVFSFDYLLAKTLERNRLNDLLAEMYYFRQINEIRGCDEVNYLFGLLRKLSVKFIQTPTLLSVELAGRIGHLVDSGHQYLGHTLLGSLDKCALRTNCLLPLLPYCFSPVLRPEMLMVRFGCGDAFSLIRLTPDQRFIFTLSNASVTSDVERMIVTWEVTTLTKSLVFNLGSWPGHLFHSAHFPAQVNNVVLLSFSVRLDAHRENRGILLVNLELGKVEGRIEFPDNVQFRLLTLTRTNVLIASWELKAQVKKCVDGKPAELSETEPLATVYALSTGKPVTKSLEQIPLPCALLPGERYCIGPSSWSTDTQAETEAKRARRLSKESIRVDYPRKPNLLQLRQVQFPKRVAAWLLCPYKPAIIESNMRGEYVYVGCEAHGYVCRFDMNQLSSKDVKRLTPTVELNLDEALKSLLSTEVDWKTVRTPSGPLAWDTEILKVIYQTGAKVQVRSLWISHDDRYVAVVYSLRDTLYVIGIWAVQSKQLIAGLRASPNSQIRFGTDLGGNMLVHFVPSLPDSNWIEVVDLNVKPLGIGITSNTTQQVPSKVTDSSVNRVRMLTNLFEMPIDECYFVRGGKMVFACSGEFRLTSLPTMTQNPPGPCAFGKQLTKAIYHGKLDIIYSTDKTTDDLLAYYNLITQRIVRVSSGRRSEDIEDFFLGPPLLETFPSASYMSDDGGCLALVYDVIKISEADDSHTQRHKERMEDYVKPHIPRINYFTSQYEQAGLGNWSATLGTAHEQKVVRVYDLKHTGAGTGLRCQISLLGEAVFQLSTKHGLFTLRPDHASSSRLKPIKLEFQRPQQQHNQPDKTMNLTKTTTEITPKAILSRYSSTTGEYLGQSYLDHPVINESQLVGNDAFLLLCCGPSGRWLRLLAAPEFSKIVYEVNVAKVLKQHDDYARNACVSRVFTCASEPSMAVIQYTWAEQTTPIHIATFNLQAQSPLVAQFESTLPLVDVTADGQLGVDGTLKLYNLQQGTLIATLCSPGLIPGLTEEPQILRVQITSDRAYLLTVIYSSTQPDPWLLVIQNNPVLRFPVVGLAVLSPISKNEPEKTKLSPRPASLPCVRIATGHNGRLIVISLDDHNEFKVFALHDNLAGALDVVYTSAAERVRSLLPLGRLIRDPSLWNNKQRAAKNVDDLFTKFGQSMAALSQDIEDLLPNEFFPEEAGESLAELLMNV
ncbi:hypothetical protein AHF37_03425 [Paragonimus kellicotti]|nr:hypothetical protein AHF37_03425 [Paragonimus kellicotti]